MPRFCLVFITAATLVAAAHTADASPRRRDPRVALGLSLGVTLAGPALLYLGDRSNSDVAVVAGAAALALGPSAGEWYSGKAFTWGLAIRATGALIATVGLVSATCWDDCSRQDQDRGVGLLVAGGAAMVGGALYDIIDAPAAANQFNDAYHLDVSPTLMHGEPGLVVAGAF